MRVLFFGTADFAVPSLKALALSEAHEVLGVVTQPDRPRGRGLNVTESSVKKAARALGLKVMQPKRVRSQSFISTVREMNPDAFALAAFGQIIPQELLDIPSMGPINVHGSLLPAYRGAAPIQRAIMNGDSVTGVTTIWMNAALDAGDMLLKAGLPIGSEDTSETLTARMADLGAGVLLQTLSELELGTCPRVSQNHLDATFAPAITQQDCEVDWTESAERVRNRVRALSPRPGAFGTFRGRRIKVWTVFTNSPGRHEISAPGVVYRVDRDKLEVETGMGGLVLAEVQPENSRRMTGGEWARGARIIPGDRFDVET